MSACSSGRSPHEKGMDLAFRERRTSSTIPTAPGPTFRTIQNILNQPGRASEIGMGQGRQENDNQYKRQQRCYFLLLYKTRSSPLVYTRTRLENTKGSHGNITATTKSPRGGSTAFDTKKYTPYSVLPPPAKSLPPNNATPPTSGTIACL